MKNPILTFYVFGAPRYGDDRAKPRLLKLEGIEMKNGVRAYRHGRVKLTKSSPQFGHSTIIGRGSLFTTPEMALVSYRQELHRAVERARKELKTAEWLLDRCPDEPGKIHEDV